ncbi:hypothetical protein ACVIGA_003486 [Bradyrhizobium sp. USDA 3240]
MPIVLARWGHSALEQPDPVVIGPGIARSVSSLSLPFGDGVRRATVSTGRACCGSTGALRTAAPSSMSAASSAALAP